MCIQRCRLEMRVSNCMHVVVRQVARVLLDDEPAAEVVALSVRAPVGGKTFVPRDETIFSDRLRVVGQLHQGRCRARRATSAIRRTRRGRRPRGSTAGRSRAPEPAGGVRAARTSRMSQVSVRLPRLPMIGVRVRRGRGAAVVAQDVAREDARLEGDEDGVLDRRRLLEQAEVAQHQHGRAGSPPSD